MRRMSFPLVTLAITAALPAAARAQTISPRFAWPVGATGEVTTIARTNTSAMGGGNTLADSTGMSTKATMTISAHPEGLAIATSSVTAQGGTPQMSAADLAAITQLNGSFIVSKTGSFVRLTDVSALKQRMDSVMAPSLAQVRASAPAMAGNMEKLTSPEFLTEASRQSWLQSVGALLGRSWSTTDSLVTTTVMPMPLASSGTITLPRVVRFDGVVPCPDQRPGSCWQFTSRQTLTREALRAPMLDMLRQMGAPETMIDQIPIPETTTTSVQVFDAATMLPLRSSTSVTGGGAGPLAAVLQTGSTLVTYRWK